MKTAQQLGITQEQLENLLTLASYLEGDKLKSNFNMITYSSNKEPDPELHTDCGSVGCAVGHGPHAGIPKTNNEDWVDYGNRVFGLYLSKSNAFTWMFDGQWAHIDNTPKGAALRIRYYIKNGVPENCTMQLSGIEPLCYQQN